MSSMPEGFGEVAGGIVTLALIVLVLTIVAGPVASSLGVQTSPETNQTTSVGVIGGSDTFASNVDSVNFVKADLDDSVRLTGANDSNVTIESNADLGHDLSACTWGTLDSDVVTNNEDALLLATQEAVTWYNGTSDTWEGYYYNTSSRNSFRASVSASSPAANATLVCLNHANQSLNISANTTTGSSVATGSSNIADYPSNVTNWNGTVEETRLYATPLNGSQRTEWVGEPGLAVQGPAPATRVTYDTFTEKTTFNTYFASGSATAGNATQVSGFDAPAPSEGTDYSLSGGTITLLDTGQFDANGEVVYIAYGEAGITGPMSGVLTTLFNLGESALTIVVLGLLALAGFAVVNQIDEF